MLTGSSLFFISLILSAHSLLPHNSSAVSTPERKFEYAATFATESPDFMVLRALTPHCSQAAWFAGSVYHVMGRLNHTTNFIS